MNINTSTTIRCFTLCAALGASAGTPAVAGDIPPRPEQLAFPPLKFEVPDAKDFRHTLSNGLVVYMDPSKEFPLVSVSFAFKGGSYLEPAEKAGLADATGSMMRRGGTTTIKAQELDEQIDFLAAQISTHCADVESSASLNCLKSNFDESFKLFMDIVRNPGFQQDKFDVYKGEVLESLKQRNDDAGPILNREWSALMYGREHFESLEPTKKSLESITIDDMKAFHDRIFRPTPGNLVIAVTGDFDVKDMLAKLEVAFKGWTSSPSVGSTGDQISDPPAPSAKFTPGVYHIEKDIPQGKVYIGLRGITRDDPDFFPVLVMNNILGGGGFTSRITNRVRSDEGLAYDAGSSMIPRVWYPGEFRASFQSKNATVALAIKIIMEEINRIRTEPVSKDELELAKDSFIETFPRTFESRETKLGVFVSDELTNRPKDYWKTYRDKVKAVTPEQVNAVAKKYLVPENMAILVVGKWDEIAKGDMSKRASMNEFFSGKSTALPLRDPLTLEPIQ
jgi:zinc protease